MEQFEIDLIAAVRELSRTTFVERARDYDREGAFAAENVRDLQKLGVTGMFVPKGLGGLGISAEAQTRIVEEVAYGDGSTAVALNMHLFGGLAVAGMPPLPFRDRILREIAEGALVCGPISVPTGELDNRTSGVRFREEGDFLYATGKVGFASMSDAATYVITTGQLPRDNAEPDFVIAFVRADAPGLKNLHNWDAMGLRATASHDIVFEDARIPKADGFVIPAAMLRALAQVSVPGSNMVFTRSVGALGITAIWLGLAQAAYDFTLDYVKKRHGLLAGVSPLVPIDSGFRAQEPWAQMGVGEMDHWLSTGRIVLYDLVRRLDTAVQGDQQALNQEMVRVIYHLRRMGEEVAAGAMRTCGAHAYVRARSLERIFRDLVGSNVMAWKTDMLRQTLGQAALGIPITVGGPAPA
ncbi:MAG: acyl-CoA dehydrogenase family protein [Dehalococcoidia bacterium]